MGREVQTSDRPPAPWNSPMERKYDVFLSQLSAKGRATVEKHDELCESDGGGGGGQLWKRFAGELGKLAGHATELYGQNAVKFYIQDGKYKQQVFALEDAKQGKIAVYLPDVVHMALERKILGTGTASNSYSVRGAKEPVHFLPIDSETKDLTVCKAMVGWGRKALRAELDHQTPEDHVRAVELMCGLAAEKWAAAQG